MKEKRSPLFFHPDLCSSYAGDAKIKAKVKGIVCGIKDIQFIGDLRIIFSPLINTVPLFGAVSYFFLKTPVEKLVFISFL